MGKRKSRERVQLGFALDIAKARSSSMGISEARMQITSPPRWSTALIPAREKAWKFIFISGSKNLAASGGASASDPRTCSTNTMAFRHLLVAWTFPKKCGGPQSIAAKHRLWRNQRQNTKSG